MQKDPIVSVVIPSYNRAHCIENAIASVQAQEHFGPGEIEIIVVDDASTDNTLTLLSRLQKEQPNLKIIHHSKNRGVSAARNTGIKIAAAQYIAFLDSDDIWHSSKLILQFNEVMNPQLLEFAQQMVKKGQVVPLDTSLAESIFEAKRPVCLTYYFNKNESGEITINDIFVDEYDDEGIPKLKTYTPSELKRGAATWSLWFGIGSTFFAHRSVIERIGFFNEELGCGEDTEYLLRHILGGGEIKVVPHPLMTYSLPDAKKLYSGQDNHYPYMADQYRCLIATQFDPAAAEKFIENLRGFHAARRNPGQNWAAVAHEITVKHDSPCEISEFDCSLKGRICRPLGADPGDEWAANRALKRVIKTPSPSQHIAMLESIMDTSLIAQIINVTEHTVRAWRLKRREPSFYNKIKIQAALQIALYLQERGVEERGCDIANWFRERNVVLNGISPFTALRKNQEKSFLSGTTTKIFHAAREFCDNLPGAYRPVPAQSNIPFGIAAL